jgi:D-alanyl-D-alanine carboxypeptidase/D-alanyl-D-alanine-endopeptidase (penicillin-binding protein 4)
MGVFLFWASSVTAISPVMPLKLSQNGDYANQSFCPTEFATEIETLLQRSEFVRSYWGIFIAEEKTQAVLYQHNADQLFVPASNTKLLTTAAALLTLGPNYQLQTPFYGQGQAPVLEALTIIAQGDPTLTRDSLTAIAAQLQAKGITEIKTVVLEDNSAPENRLNPTWEWEDIHYDYAPPINRAILNQNTVTLTLTGKKIGEPAQITWSEPLAAQQWQVVNQTRTVAANPSQNIQIQGLLAQNTLVVTGELSLGSQEINGVAIPDPTLYFLQTFQQLLKQQGIQVDRVMMTNQANLDRTQIPLLTITSPKLGTMIQTTNQDSNNLYAESLLNLLNPLHKAGSEPVKTALQSLGLDPNTYFLKDGSGLSRQNLVSPRLLGQLLLQINKTPFAKTYQDSLAIAGQNGTLKNRFLQTALVGKLQAKTGTLSGITSLAGYLANIQNQTLIFSILVNNSDRTAPELRQTIDQILQKAYTLQPCAISHTP